MHIVSLMTSSDALHSDALHSDALHSDALHSDAHHGDSQGWTPQLWAILFVLGGALCLDGLDVSMVGVALPSIRSALGLGTSSLQWIVSGYVLGYGGLLLLGGRAADLLGRRRVFLVALTVTAAMLLLVYTVVSAQQAGWGSARTVGSFAAVTALLWVFAVIERRSRDPLVPFGIFSSRPLRRANVGAVTLFGTYISFQFLVTQYLQTLAGWSALSTALAFLPAGVMVVVLSTRMASLLSRFGPAPLTALAFSCLVIAYMVFLRAGVRPDYPAVMLPATLLIGLAFGLGFSSLSVAATAGVPDAEQGLAASLFQTSFQVGGAVVLAVVTAVVDASGVGRVASATATLAAYRPALILITGVAAVGALVALSGLRSQRDVAVAQADEPAAGTAPAEVATVPEFAKDSTAA